MWGYKKPLGPQAVIHLFLGGKNPPNMKWTNKKKINIDKQLLKIRNRFAR